MTPRPHAAALAPLGLSDALLRSFEIYLDLLARWSPRMNLTGAASPEERVRILVRDPLLAAPELRGGRLIDVGTGNGSPGLLLALARPEIPATLLEPRQKRWAFLREAARAVGREDIEVRRVRSDGYTGPPAETVTLRALALPLDALAPLVVPGGRILVFGGEPQPRPPFRASGTKTLATLTLHTFER